MDTTSTLHASRTRTSRSQRADRLANPSEYLRDVFRASPLPISVSRIDNGTFIEVNDAWLELFEFERTEVIGHTSFDLDMWNDREQRPRLCKLLMDQKFFHDVHVPMRKKGGEAVDVLLSASHLAIKEDCVCVAAYGDLTQFKQAERKLQQSEERFAKIFQASPDAIVITRVSDGKYLEVNQAWLDVCGYAREDLLGRSALELGIWVDQSERARMLNILAEQGSVRNFEARLRKKNGDVADVLLSAEKFDLDGESYMIVPLSDITERKRAEERMQYLATRDALTGLPNRLLLTDRLALSIGNARRGQTQLALLFVDLDWFKNINDSLGHLVGDAFLRAVAERLSNLMRKGDTLARLGSDEFVILLENVRSAEEAAQVARKVLDAFSAPFTVEGRTLGSSCSIGISLFPSDAADAQTLISYADTAMHHAKENGRVSYQYFSTEMNARMLERLWLENGLRDALARDQLELVYQPKVNIATGKISGAEALVRWRHPELGLILPERFIPVAEETGLILDLGLWVLKRACSQLREWRELGYPAMPVALNLSVRQFRSGLVEDIEKTVTDAGIDPSLIELEITESLFMRDMEDIGEILIGLADMGMNLTIDDFGTGYASLNYIKRFLVNSLKIDRSFISDMTDNSHDKAIVKAMVAMAQSLGIKVIAEGVEADSQLQLLRQLGCNEYQGFLFSKPLLPEELQLRFLVRPWGNRGPGAVH